MSLSFEDDRLPTQAFDVMCPRCRQSVTIMPPPKEEPKLPGVAATMDAVIAGKPVTASDPLQALAELLLTGLRQQPQDTGLASWQRRPILFCVDDAQTREHLRASLDHRRYEIFSSDTAPEAIEILHDSRAEVIVITPSFEAQNQGCGAIMQYVNTLTPQARRRMYVVLVSSQVRTLDTYLAFANGVNLTLHTDDAASFQAVFERSLRDFNELYRPYNAAASVTPF
jgi:hypothetical protein